MRQVFLLLVIFLFGLAGFAGFGNVRLVYATDCCPAGQTTTDGVHCSGGAGGITQVCSGGGTCNMTTTPPSCVTAAQTGTFNCHWDGTKCVVCTFALCGYAYSASCQSGYEPSDPVCNSKASNETDCANLQPQNCVSTGTPAPRWKCDTTTWTCPESDSNDPTATYTSLPNCLAQCIQSTYGGPGGPGGSTTTTTTSHQCTPSSGGLGTDTAIGCIPQDLKPFLTFMLSWVLGISGGLILLMLIATCFSLLTSQGNPEKLQAAKENLVSIFSGLVLIGFSLLLLQVIGAKVLLLPTF